MPDQAPVPLTLLAGFLGSGKTTLLNRILAAEDSAPVAVVVNEFGDVPIDGKLVVGATDDLIELANGCVCCTVRGDLADTLTRLIEARSRRLFRKRFERIVVEGSGLASPGPIVQTLVITPGLQDRIVLDGVLVLCHAARIAEQLDEFPEAADQVGYADRILLNHTDRCDPPTLEAAERAIRDRNGAAELSRCVRAEVDVASLLDLGTTDPGHWKLDAPEPSEHRHGPDVGTAVLRSSAPMDLHRLKMWLQFLASKRDHEILRLKGILRCVDHGPPVVVQSVYQWLELGPGEGDPPAESILVLIGRNLEPEELQRGFGLCAAADPAHQASS